MLAGTWLQQVTVNAGDVPHPIFGVICTVQWLCRDIHFRHGTGMLPFPQQLNVVGGSQGRRASILLLHPQQLTRSLEAR
ncbi:MAG TPA: hypothetical protein VE134_03655, partial [Methanomicrobiales archaeon]|nr:hypothetical protein [Methanomicrobiales archaeon]